MPIYQYECRSCQHAFELQQSMKDDAISECPECHKNDARRIITGAGIVFKGTGFYVNDKNTTPTCTKPGCQVDNVKDLLHDNIRRIY